MKVDYYRIRLSYQWSVLSGVAWLLIGGFFVYEEYGWLTHAFSYYGPWDYGADPFRPDPSYFAPGLVVGGFMLVAGIVLLVSSVAAYWRAVRQLERDPYHKPSEALRTILALSIVMLLALVWAVPWWLQTYTD